MKTYKVAICDDESNIIGAMKGVISAAFGKAGVPVDIEAYTSVDSLSRRINTQTYDLLFLDICMPKCDGITFGEQLRKAGDTTDIIFVSNRDDKVFDALKIRPFGFVRKNNFLNEITAALNNYLNTLSLREATTITVQGKGSIVTVRASEVVYIEGSGKYQLMHVVGKTEPLSVYKSMEKLEEELDKFGFIRIHKGFMVNYRFISRILVGEIELTTDEKLPLSRRKITEIKQKYLMLLKNGGSIVL